MNEPSAFVNRQDGCVTPCNDAFHKDCIKPWIEEYHECPNCKALVTVKDLKCYHGGPKKANT